MIQQGKLRQTKLIPNGRNIRYKSFLLSWSKSRAMFIKFKNLPRVPAFRTSSRASPSFPSSRLGLDLARPRATSKSIQIHQNIGYLFNETPLVNSAWLLLQKFGELWWVEAYCPETKWGTVWEYVSLNPYIADTPTWWSQETKYIYIQTWIKIHFQFNFNINRPKKRPDTDTEEPHQAASHSCQDPWPKKYFLFQKVSRVSLFEGNVLEESPIKSSKITKKTS